MRLDGSGADDLGWYCITEGVPVFQLLSFGFRRPPLKTQPETVGEGDTGNGEVGSNGRELILYSLSSRSLLYLYYVKAERTKHSG